MNVHLIAESISSPVTAAVKHAAEKKQWQLNLSAPTSPKINDLPICTLNLVLIDASDQHCFDAFIRWYKNRQHIKPQLIKYIAFDTQYDTEKALDLAGLYDIEYTELPHSETGLEKYLRRASGIGKNFYDIARSLKTNVFAEIVDQYALTSVTDADGLIQYVNQNLVDISGYTFEELAGQNHRILKSDRHKPIFYSNLWKTISSGRVWRGRICNRSKLGEEYWVDSFIFPVKDASGAIRNYISFRYDITKEVEFKEQLMLRDERVRISHDYANVGTWDWNIKTGQLYWSEEIHRLFGYEEPVLETSYGNFLRSIHPEDREMVITRVNESINYGTPYSVEHRVIHPNGNIRWLAERGHVLRDNKGDPVRMLGVVSDIHELIEAKKNAIEAEKVKSTFISTLSHEIRNPLNAASGFSRIIADLSTTKDIAKYAGKIETIIDHISGILEDIDLNNKLETTNISHSKTAVSLQRIIDESVEIIGTKASNVSIHKQNIEGWAWADEQHLRQVIINLLSNAIKYNKEKGSVYIRTKRTGNSSIRIEVEDTGWGIKQEHADRLFKPYERLQWKNSEVEGLGLGLPICKKLVEGMSGKIGLSSTISQGSVFWIELPETYASNSTPSQKPPDIGLLQKLFPLKALVLDDNEFNLEFMKIQLETLGIETDIATNGREGLYKLEKIDYDFILTDINMPLISGEELITTVRLHASESIRRIPIIVVTAIRNDRKSYLDAGASACLSKPIKKESLISLLLEILERPFPEYDRISESIIDENCLRHHIGNHPQRLARLISIFLKSLSSEMENIKERFQSGDMDSIAKIAHKISSPSLSIGANVMAQQFADLEEAAKMHDRKASEKILESLELMSAKVKTCLVDIINATYSRKELEHEIIDTDIPIRKANNTTLNMLIVDDDEFSIKQLSENLREFDSVSYCAEQCSKSALELLSKNHFDVIVLDINMPNIDGIQFIRHLSHIRDHQAIILYSNEASVIHSLSELIDSYGMQFVGTLKKPSSKLAISRLLASFRNPHTDTMTENVAISDLQIETSVKEERVLLLFQPQISLKSNQVVATEALSRIVDENGNIIGPYQFLPRLDDLGLELRFTYLVARKAIMQLSLWRQLGLDIRMSINFSMKALEDTELPDRLIDICEYYDIDKDKVIVEVTETALSSQPRLFFEVLVRLKLAGFSLSIDDFGTGYSSLDKLQKFPFTEIKLDRSYVSRAATDEISLALLTSSISLANQLGIATIAEGVETQQDYELVLNAGADTVQGFYFAKPMLPGNLQSWIKEFNYGRKPI